MRVLLLESDRHAADATMWALEGAGHEVVRCHEPDLSAFPCNALCDEGACPLDDPRSVDVAVTYRAHAYPRPTAYEDGIICALRRGVPVVVGGVSALNPFDRWTTAVATDSNLAEVCESVATSPVQRLAEPARAEVRRRLAGEPAVAERSDVEVLRHGNRLAATITLPEEAREVDGQLAVAVAAVLRAHHPVATCIDVAVQRRS